MFIRPSLPRLLEDQHGDIDRARRRKSSPTGNRTRAARKAQREFAHIIDEVTHLLGVDGGWAHLHPAVTGVG
jgi:hypothetical protein